MEAKIARGASTWDLPENREECEFNGPKRIVAAPAEFRLARLIPMDAEPDRPEQRRGDSRQGQFAIRYFASAMMV